MDEKKLGKAWRKIVSDKASKKEKGLKELRDMEANGDVESAISLAMFESSKEDRRKHLEKAILNENAEALWQYSNLLEHNHVPDLTNEKDLYWVEMVLKAAKKEHPDAMLEMGNICNRLSKYMESFYWYFRASLYEHPQGESSASFAVKKWVSAGESDVFENVTDFFTEDKMKICLVAIKSFRNIPPSESDAEILLGNALLGDDVATLFYGGMLEQHGGLPLAMTLFTRAAEGGNSYAMRCMGDIWMAFKKEKDALSWYKKAAELGEKHAMFVMGESLRNKDKNSAARWYAMSYIRGYSPAFERLKQLKSRL